jgi:hypothetical protein
MSATPESAPVSTEKDPDSGASLRGSFAFYDPVSCSLKMSQLCLLGVPIASSVILPRAGTLLNGECFERQTSVPRIVESDCLSWPTPKSSIAGPDFAKLDRSATGISLQTAAALWATPTAQDSNGRDRHNQRDGSITLSLLGQSKLWTPPRASDGEKGSPNQTQDGLPALASQAVTASRWPPPTVQDAENTGGPSQFDRNSIPLNAAVTVSHPGPTGSLGGMVLNPQFVEEMMGFPAGWTALDASEMRSFRKSRRTPGKP